MPDIKSIKCASCGGNVQLDFDNLISYCPYCGAALSMDLASIKDILIEKEKTIQHRDEMTFENEKDKREKTNNLILIIISAVLLVFMIILLVIVAF